MNRIALLCLTTALLFASCSPPAAPTLPQASHDTAVHSVRPTTAQLHAAQAQASALRAASSATLTGALEWNEASLVQNHLLYVPIEGKAATAVLDLTEATEAITIETFQADGALHVTTTFLTTGNARTDRINADGSITVIARTTAHLHAQATCGDLREDIQDLRKEADAADKTALFFGLGGLVSLEAPPVAAVAALGAVTYRNDALEARRKADVLKKVYTRNCA